MARALPDSDLPRSKGNREGNGDREGPSLPLDIGSRLELFVDDYLVARMRGVRFKLHPPRPAEKVLAFDRPWEGVTSAYITVLKDGDLYRMYYRGSAWAGEPQVTCYAESDDGVHWRRPCLGLYEHEGCRANNIVWRGAGAHNLAPFRDANPQSPADQRYKALAGAPPLALVSADGIRWKKLREAPVLARGAFDSQNVAFWDAVRGRYTAYLRVYRGGGRSGERAIACSTSADFVHWSNPRPIDLGDTPPEHLYTNATTPYGRAPQVLFAFPSRFLPERRAVEGSPLPGVSDTVLMASRDGLRFERRFMEAFIRPGRDRRNWTDRNNMVAWGVVPTAPDELSLYVSRHFRHPTAHLQRHVLRTDGFVSVHAPYAGGELLTHPLVLSGRYLTLNYATSAAGSLRVELQDVEGRPIPGYGLGDCCELYGDEIEGRVAWAEGTDMGPLAGRPARLRFVLRDADLYALRFSAAPPRA